MIILMFAKTPYSLDSSTYLRLKSLLLADYITANHPELGDTEIYRLKYYP